MQAYSAVLGMLSYCMRHDSNYYSSAALLTENVNLLKNLFKGRVLKSTLLSGVSVAWYNSNIVTFLPSKRLQPRGTRQNHGD